VASLTIGAARIVPRLVLSYRTERSSRNVFHEVIGQVHEDVTLRPPSLRRGELRLLFLDEATADAAEVALTQLGAVTYIDETNPKSNMIFVLDGSLVRELDEETKLRWILTLGFREVGDRASIVVPQRLSYPGAQMFPGATLFPGNVS
jgi:hypothetical protein